MPQNSAWFYDKMQETSGIPPNLPPNSIIVLHDQEYTAYDPDKVASFVSQYDCSGVLLDLQKINSHSSNLLIEALDQLHVPFCVSASYAQNDARAVFIPPVPLTIPLAQYIAPWRGRTIWLELALDGQLVTVTPDSSTERYLPAVKYPSEGRHDQHLHCHYEIKLTEQAAIFTLWRTKEDIDELLIEADQLGISLAIGLWQELK